MGDEVRGDLPWGPVAPPDPLLPAAQHPATRAWLRRWLSSGLVLTLLGAALAPIAWVLLVSVSDRCASFLSPDYLTTGYVVSVDGGRGRSSISVELVDTSRTVTVDVVAPDLYDVGEDVLLVGSGDEWFVLPCSDNASSSSTWLAVGTVLLMGFGVPILFRALMLRRRLVREPWREVTAYVGWSSPWWQQGRVWHVRIDGTCARVLLGVPLVQDPVFEPPSEGAAHTVRLWVAGPLEGGHVPIAAPGGRSVLALRVASSQRQREAWAAVVDGTPERG